MLQPVEPGRVEQIVGRGRPARVNGLPEGVGLTGLHSRAIRLLQLLRVIAKRADKFMVRHGNYLA